MNRSLYNFVKERPRHCNGLPGIDLKELYRKLTVDACPACRAPSVYGSVFNIQFSPVEDYAVAVCSNRSVVIYDPRTESKVHATPNAHDDCVNCVTFLDNCTFVTCSDDHTIRLWDIRSPRACLEVLRGHTGWVKNIEYDRKSGLLFSIAFLDGLRIWDINKPEQYKGQEETNNEVFRLPDPVRARLSPDGSKMFIALRKNKCVVIDNFDGKSIRDLATDMEDLLKNPEVSLIQKRLQQRDSNRPSLHFMTSVQFCRCVMSVCFHPSSEFVSLRHIDTKKGSLLYEFTTLYDLRSSSAYQPLCKAPVTRDKYLLYADEFQFYAVESVNYIKEINFSRDGRVLASPCERGVRLLAVDLDCTPADVYFDPRYRGNALPAQQGFEVIHRLGGHKGDVLTTCFANNDFTLASGCFEGEVLFHKPQL